MVQEHVKRIVLSACPSRALYFDSAPRHSDPRPDNLLIEAGGGRRLAGCVADSLYSTPYFI